MPKGAIGDLEGRSSATPLVDGKLVTQREDLELEGRSRSEAGPERGDEGEEDCLHEGMRAASYPTKASRRRQSHSAKLP